MKEGRAYEERVNNNIYYILILKINGSGYTEISYDPKHNLVDFYNWSELSINDQHDYKEL